MEGPEDRITALLQLRSRLEQELRADTLKLEEVKIACAQKVKWMRYLDEVISDSSFTPASEMLGRVPASDPSPRVDPDDAGLPDAFKPVNIKHPVTGALLASINFLEGNVSIAFGEGVKIGPESPVFTGAIRPGILALFEKEGGRTFLERDEQDGYLRSITILGHFPSGLKDKVASDLGTILASPRAGQP